MEKSFFKNDHALLTVMVQAENPERIKELIRKAAAKGAEAFGIQFEQLKNGFKNKETYLDLFQNTSGLPVYITNYRYAQNAGKTDKQLADELIEFAEYGANLCDVMGDIFDKQPDEMAVDAYAIKKQMCLIDEIHKRGAKVLMSSHIHKYTPIDRVLDIALEHQSRGADICKIVTGADSMYEQIENLKIIATLKEKLDIPFLFLCGGECGLLRRIGGEIGNCMYLCVYEYDKLATPVQPLLEDLLNITERLRKK